MTTRPRGSSRLLVLTLLFFASMSALSAQVVLTLTADSPDATVITITASGTNTVQSGGVAAGSIGRGALPTTAGSWNGSSGNWQMLGLDTNFDSNDFVLNGTSTLQMAHNGVAFGSIWSQVEAYQHTIGYQFQIGPTSAHDYPIMNAGDTYGMVGSVSYTLINGMTASAFTEGSFANAINGGNFVWTVSYSAVPEPSTYATIAGALMLGVRDGVMSSHIKGSRRGHVVTYQQYAGGGAKASSAKKPADRS